jgi:hypothetical protein
VLSRTRATQSISTISESILRVFLMMKMWVVLYHRHEVDKSEKNQRKDSFLANGRGLDCRAIARQVFDAALPSLRRRLLEPCEGKTVRRLLWMLNMTQCHLNFINVSMLS